MSYISLTPYRFHCSKVLPLVYDDTLSYYEQLCKLVKKLNDTIIQVNANTEAIAELQELVASIQLILEDYESFKTATNNSISSLNSSVTNINADLTELEERVATLEEELLGVTSLVNDINGEVI